MGNTTGQGCIILARIIIQLLHAACPQSPNVYRDLQYLRDFVGGVLVDILARFLIDLLVISLSPLYRKPLPQTADLLFNPPDILLDNDEGMVMVTETSIEARLDAEVHARGHKTAPATTS